MRRKLTPILFAVAAVLALAACDEGQSAAQQAEVESRNASYEHHVAAEPAKPMTYSPTRRTINAWIETWNQPGQLAYTYILNNQGQKIGYYVFEGPPVSSCAALTPTWQFVGTPQDGSNALDQQVPAPSVDGVYYSGGQCLAYYGVDATTKRIVEFTICGALNYVLATQPLDLDVPPLGPTTIDQVADRG